MNVCLLNDSFPPLFDGVANTVINYADVISRSYGSAAVVTPSYPDADDSRFSYPVIRYPSLRNRIFVGYRIGNPLSIKAVRQAVQLAPDVIHCHTPAVSILLAQRIRRKTGAPLIFTYHTKFDIEFARITRSRLLQNCAKRAMSRVIEKCDDVWSVCDGAADNLRSLGYRGDIFIMRNGTDMPRGKVDAPSMEKLRTELQLPEGVPVFLFVGRMIRYKGLDLIVSALASYQKAGHDFRMIFVGDGMDLEAVRNEAAEVGIADRCIFTGRISDRTLLRTYYSIADLFLLPSTYDNGPITVREALACACPSVLIGGSSSAEEFTDDRTAFFIEETAESLYAKLTEIGDDRVRLRRVGETALNEMYLTWEDAVARAVDRYRYVLAQKKAREDRK